MISNPRAWMPANTVALFDQFRFEARTTIGRMFARKVYRFDSLHYLQLGCGANRYPGFLNTDCFLNKTADLHIDLRFPLPLESESWQGIYAHHTVEHMSDEDAQKLFRECFRILKPGGIFRIAVPDVELFLRCYAASDPQERQKIFTLYPEWIMKELKAATPMDVVNHVFRDFKFNRHLSAWDYQTLSLRLTEAGFKPVQTKAGESADPMLSQKDNPRWADHSLYVDAVK